MRRGMTVSLIIISLAALAGCAGQELTDVTLIQTLGVDGPGPVELTALGDDYGQGVRYHTRGETVTDAQESLKSLGDTRLEVTHVAQVVLGETADVEDTLWREVMDRKSGYGATVWLTQGPAADLLAWGQDPSRRLKALEENGGVRAPTILEALSTLVREGRVELPVLAISEGELALAGYQIVEAR